MYNLNGFLIRPARIALISPVRQVPGQDEYAFRVVLDGGYEHVCICTSFEAATRSRHALIAACSDDDELLAAPAPRRPTEPPRAPAPAATKPAPPARPRAKATTKRASRRTH